MSKSYKMFMTSSIFLFWVLNFSGRLPEPQLTIRSQGKTLSYGRAALLARPDLEKIVLENIPTYPRIKIEYLAVPLSHLFEGIRIEPSATIQFQCLDGFSAPMSPAKILESGPEKSIAYLAIETEKQPWPPINLQQGPQTAGPFFLIWKNANLSQIGKEEWPYQLKSFEVSGALKDTFPKIFPPTSFDDHSPTARGFRVFQRSCFTCHKINDQGLSDFAPDLNLPKSPTEYYSEKTLRAFVRNPQNIRQWKNDKMLGFSPQDLPETDLSDLIEYLKTMAKYRTRKNQD